jgi:hypothetical protein
MTRPVAWSVASSPIGHVASNHGASLRNLRLTIPPNRRTQ